jgi:ankyrin repeat protein
LLARRAPQLIHYLITLYPEAFNTADNKGRLPLHCACSSGASCDVLLLLLDRYAGDDRNHRGLSVVDNIS